MPILLTIRPLYILLRVCWAEYFSQQNCAIDSRLALALLQGPGFILSPPRRWLMCIFRVIRLVSNSFQAPPQGGRLHKFQLWITFNRLETGDVVSV